ncbi:MAG: hypothetical protein ACYDGR_04970 [Candidatus Dormibacteria bacterium]
MTQLSFRRDAGLYSIAAGLGGLTYTVSYVFLASPRPRLAAEVDAVLLLLGGLLTSAVFVGLYNALRGEAGGGYALWGLVLGEVGAVGATIHGGYNLSALLSGAPLTLPASQVDPRGLLTFGITGAATLVFAAMMSSSQEFRPLLSYLGILDGCLLMLVFYLHLVGQDARGAIFLLPALGAGFVVSPLWYVWLGWELRQERESAPAHTTLALTPGSI